VVTPMPPGGGRAGAGPPPPPPPPTGIEPVAGQAPPAGSVAQNALPGPGGETGVPAGAPITASASMDAGLNLFLVANATVLRAMERAGKRMLTRATAGQFSATPVFELHTMLPVRSDIDTLLAGAWDQMSALADAVDPRLDVARLQEALHAYCGRLLVTRQPHRPELLAGFLRQNGLLNGQP
jgi:hypothetical protein